MHLHPEPDYIYEPWLHKTRIFSSENVVGLHNILKKGDVNYFDLSENIKNFGFNYWLIYAFTLIAFAFVCLCLSRLKLKENQIYIKNNRILNLNKLIKNFQFKERSSFKFILLFFTLFIWFSNLFLQGNMKVSKVVVSA